MSVRTLGTNRAKPSLGTRLNRHHPLATGLVGCWLMNEGGGSTVYDVGPYGNHGAMTNHTWGWGQDGSVVAFNGTTTSVNCGSDASLDDLHDAAMTAEAWIRADGWGEGLFGRIFDKSALDTLGWEVLLNWSSGIQVIVECATTDGISHSGTDDFMPDSRWHHVAFTWDDASYNYPRLWIDGQEPSYSSTQNRSGAVVSDASEDLYIGNRNNGTRTFDGAIGLVRIYNRILTHHEILELYVDPYCMFEWPVVWGWAEVLAGIVIFRRRIEGY